ncbi:MAG TPA: Rpn family recombination-promoting nuclease/putative transposase [Phaeodactylibacter sp.]|nr:Rpn family recombination-promoting nuclease/putative transposase [Phaeodactylibacter sp.]
MRYLDPKNDLTFKKVFGEHPHLLRSFLNALLPLARGQEIVSLEYLPAGMVPEIPLMKHTIVDVRCRDNRGRQFIVEMQMLWTDSFKSRVLFNASKAYVKQLDRAKEYKGLKPVYALSLVNQNFEPQLHEYYHHYALYHSEYPQKKIDGMELIFVELPKFKAQNLTEKKLQVLWLRYLTEIEGEIEQPPADLLEVPEIREALEHIQVSAFTKAELDTYDKYWDSIRSERTLLEEAEQAGLEKGIAIYQDWQSGMPKAEIALKHGLSVEQVEKLLRRLEK